MVNRSIQAKLLKMRRRGRFAAFSGETSKYTERIDRGRFQDVRIINPGTAEEDQIPTGKHVIIAVGKISLSKQVMSTGRGPDAERMAEYYARVNSFNEPIPRTKKGQLSTPMCELMLKYKTILDETREMHVNLVKNELGRLDLFFKTKPDGKTDWFFVDVDFVKKVFLRSRAYGTKRFAMDRLENNNVTWVERLVLPN